MAFKRSAVRSRLSPPKNRTSFRMPCFCFVGGEKQRLFREAELDLHTRLTEQRSCRACHLSAAVLTALVLSPKRSFRHFIYCAPIPWNPGRMLHSPSGILSKIVCEYASPICCTITAALKSSSSKLHSSCIAQKILRSL